MDLRLFDDPKPRWNHLTLPRLPQTLPPPPSAPSSTTASTPFMPSPMTLSRLHARINYSDTIGQPGPTPRSMNPSSEEEPLPSKYGMPNRIAMIPKSSTLADRARWRRLQPQASTLLVEQQQQQQQQQQQSVLDQAQELQPSSSSWLLSRHQNSDSRMLLSNMDMGMDIDGDDSCTGAGNAVGDSAPIEVNAKVAPFPSRSPTSSLFPALSRRTSHRQQLQQQEQLDEQNSGDYHHRHNNSNNNNNSSSNSNGSSSGTTDYGRFHQNRLRQMSLFPGRRQTPGWMSDLLSDLSFRQPRQLHRDEEENDDEESDDDNSELARQVIYNNLWSEDNYCGVCRVDRYQDSQRQQDDTTAAATEVKVQGPNLDNVVNGTLPTNLRHDDYTFDYDHHDEDDEHDYNTHLYAKQWYHLSTRSRLLNNTLLALTLLQKTLTRLLVISLSAASALYLLHLIPKLVRDFFIVEILWALFKTLHWTWYLIAVWPIRNVLWCLAAAFHVLMMLIWPSKTTLAIEFHVVIIYFLRRLRIEMMVKGGN